MSGSSGGVIYLLLHTFCAGVTMRRICAFACRMQDYACPIESLAKSIPNDMHWQLQNKCTLYHFLQRNVICFYKYV